MEKEIGDTGVKRGQKKRKMKMRSATVRGPVDGSSRKRSFGGRKKGTRSPLSRNPCLFLKVGAGRGGKKDSRRKEKIKEWEKAVKAQKAIDLGDPSRKRGGNSPQSIHKNSKSSGGEDHF